MKIKLTSVLVDDQDKALKFYTDVLGFVKKKDIPVGEFKFLTVVSPDEPDGVELLLEPNENPAAKTFQKALYEQGIPATAFVVQDVQKEYDRLKKLGVSSRRYRQRWNRSRTPCSMTHVGTSFGSIEADRASPWTTFPCSSTSWRPPLSCRSATGSRCFGSSATVHRARSCTSHTGSECRCRRTRSFLLMTPAVVRESDLAGCNSSDWKKDTSCS
jgi:catechol 2,3-dioxygenase-like lactoylglutathione lyase family enzyme